jgi:hypothetical protein
LVLTVPVTIDWASARGEIMKVLATARHVSAHGASLHLNDSKYFPPLNGEVTLRSSLSAEVCQARVTRVRRLASGKVDSVGIELNVPSSTIWGLTFQLQQTTGQLLEIEKAFQTNTQDLDFRVLHSLADTVEELRAVASVVHQWQELRTAGKNAYSVLDPLTSIRLRRASKLFQDLTADIDASELNNYSPEFLELAQSVERLHERITRGPHAFRDVK